MRRYLGAFLGATLCLILAEAHAATPPTNDNFADATVIASLPFTDSVIGDLVTPEPNEPLDCAGVHTAWYRFTPPVDTDVVFHTQGSVGFVSLAVYEGDTLDGLTRLACDQGEYYIPSIIPIIARAGHTYSIQISQEALTAYGGPLRLNADPGAQIRGKVTTTSGAGVEGCYVNAGSFGPSPYHSSSARTAGDGTYAITGLLPGTFRVEFRCLNLYYGEYYNDKDGYVTADQITLAAGEVLTGIDAVVRRFGSFSGVVRTTEGTPLAGVCVDSYHEGDGSYFSGAQTAADGSYMRGVVGTGTVQARFRDCSDSRKYRPLWWPGSLDRSGAGAFDVVDGENTPGIDIALPLAVRPANDDVASAAPIAQLPFTDSMNTYLATREQNEPQNTVTGVGPGCGSGGTVWYRHTAPATMRVSIGTNGSDFSPAISVYRASLIMDGALPLEPLASTCRHSYYERTVADLPVEAGETYLIQVWGSGELRLSVREEVAPANDAMSAARDVSDALPFNESVRTFAASAELGESSKCDSMSRTVWYRLSVPSNRRVTVRTSTSVDTEAAIAVYRGTGLGTGMPALDTLPVVCSAGDGYAYRTHTVSFDAAKSVAYWIQIGGEAGGGGVFTVQITDLAAPANDDRADAAMVGALPFLDEVDTVTASTAAGDQACGQMTNTVWYRYLATADEHISASTAGSDFVPALAVYRVGDLGAVPIACDTDSEDRGVRHPRADFLVRAGEEYLFQAGAQANRPGRLRFELRAETQPSNDMLAAAEPLVSTAMVRTYAATEELGEVMPCQRGGPPGRTVWYRFDAPTTGRYQLSTAGSDFDTMAGVYAPSGLPIEGPAGLTQVACNDDAGTSRNSFIEFNANAGATYLIQLSGWKYDAGVIHASIGLKPTS